LIKAKLIKSTGEELVLDIPETGSEISLSQALDFDFECLTLFDFLKEHSEDFEKRKVDYILHLINCLKVFYGDIVDFFDLDGSYVENIDTDVMHKHFETIKGEVNEAQAYDSLMGIFNLIFRAVKLCKPELREKETFIYKDETFVFPTVWKDALYRRINYQPITVKQAIETLQIQSNYAEVVRELKPNDQSIGNFLFTKYLSELAILLLKKGEVLPTDEAEFKRHMADRMNFFQDIDLQTAMDIEHWFEQYYNSLKEDKENWYYFNSKEPDSPDELKNQVKAKNKNKDVALRIGWKSMIRRLIEIGAFRGRSTNDLDSVNNAPFTDAVKMISIDNSQ